MNHENYQGKRTSITGLAEVPLSELDKKVLRLLQTAPDAGMRADQIAGDLKHESVTEAQIEEVLCGLQKKGFTEPAEPYPGNPLRYSQGGCALHGRLLNGTGKPSGNEIPNHLRCCDRHWGNSSRGYPSRLEHNVWNNSGDNRDPQGHLYGNIC